MGGVRRGTHQFRTFPNIRGGRPPRGDGAPPIPNISRTCLNIFRTFGRNHRPGESWGRGRPPVPNFFRTFPAHFRVEPPRAEFSQDPARKARSNSRRDRSSIPDERRTRTGATRGQEGINAAEEGSATPQLERIFSSHTHRIFSHAVECTSMTNTQLGGHSYERNVERGGGGGWKQNTGPRRSVHGFGSRPTPSET